MLTTKKRKNIEVNEGDAEEEEKKEHDTEESKQEGRRQSGQKSNQSIIVDQNGYPHESPKDVERKDVQTIQKHCRKAQYTRSESQPFKVQNEASKPDLTVNLGKKQNPAKC